MTSHAGYAHRSPVKRPEWHSLIAWDMFFNNLATGLFLAAATCELALPAAFRAPARWAYPLAFGSLLVDLLCLVLDLGDPLRFHHMLRVFKPSSPMSLGTWCLTAFSLPLTVIVAIEVLPQTWRNRLSWLHATCLVLGILPALGSAIYKGVLISTSSQPGWKDARWLGGYLANSAVFLGCAGLLILSTITGANQAGSILRIVFATLLLTNTIVLSLLAMELRGPLSGLHDRSTWTAIAVGILGGGVIVPSVLIAIGTAAIFKVTAAILVFASSLAIRFLIVKLPHSTP